MSISNVNFSCLSKEDILKKIFTEIILKRESEVVTFLDASSMVRLKRNSLFTDYLKMSNYIFADGYYVYWAAKKLNLNVVEQVTGFDLTMDILEKAVQNNKLIYLLGSKERVLQKLLLNIRENFSNEIIGGYKNGYYFDHEMEDIITDINSKKIDILLIGIGYPRREQFISYSRDKLKVGVIIGVGGVFDILGGEVKRAPRLMILLKLEWLYRFIQEPRRMWRRVFFDYPVFLLCAIAEILIKRKNDF